MKGLLRFFLIAFLWTIAWIAIGEFIFSDNHPPYIADKQNLFENKNEENKTLPQFYLKEENILGSITYFGSEKNKDKNKHVIKIIQTESNVSKDSRIFNTNFNISEETVTEIEKIKGIEFASKLSLRYSIVVKIGKAFTWDEIESKINSLLGDDGIKQLLKTIPNAQTD